MTSLPREANAQNTWKGVGTNWSTNISGGVWTPDWWSANNGATLQFDSAAGGGTTLSNNMDAWNDYSLIFNSGAATFTIVGNAFDVLSKIENNSTATQTISVAAISAGNSIKELNPVSGNLVINIADLFTGGSNGEWRVWGDKGNTLSINGVISEGGAFSIQRNTTVIFQKTNTYSGQTMIHAGQIIISNGARAGTGNINLGGTNAAGSSATNALYLGTSSSSGGVTNTNAINVNAGGGASTIGGNNTSGVNTYTGPITLNTNVTLRSGGGTLRFEGTVGSSSGGRTVTISGGRIELTTTTSTSDSRWSISSDASLAVGSSRNFGADPGGYYSDKITLAGGTLIATNSFSLNSNVGVQVTSASTIQVGDGFTLTNPAVMGGTAALTKTGNGTLVLSAANTNSGGVVLSVGTLRVGNDGALGTGTLSVTAASTFASMSGTAYGINNAVVANSNFTIGDGTGTGNLTFSNTFNLGTNNRTLTVANNSTISGQVSHGNLIKIGSGTLTLSGNNASTFTNATVGTGVLGVSGGAAISDSGAVILSNVAGATFLVSANETIGSLRGGGGTGGNVSIASGQTLTVAEAGSETFSGVISNAGGLTKSGAGTLTLSGNNTFSGMLTVASGKLTIETINNASADGVLGNSANAVVLGGANEQEGFLHYIGATTNSTKTFTAATGGTAGLEVSNASTTLTLSGAIGGSGGVTKGGAGILHLTGENTFGGALNIHAGTLRVDALNSLGTNANAIGLGKSGSGNTTTFLFSGSTNATSSRAFNLADSGGLGIISVSNAATALTLSGLLSGSGRFEKAGAGTLVLSDNNSYSGTTLVADGTLSIGAGGTTGSLGSSTITNNATLLYNRSDNLTQSTVIHGAGALHKIGAGTLTLGGANTYTGKTTISAGAINVSAASGLGGNPTGATADQLTLNGGRLNVTTGFTNNANAGITVGAGNGTIDVASGQRLVQGGGLYGSGALTKTGEGTVSLTNTASSYSGILTVTNGVLQVNSSNRGATINVGNASTLNGSVLMGSGSVGAVTINTNGRISPGNSVGTLSVSNSLTFNGGGSYLWEITNTTAGAPGTNWDLITVDGATVGDGAGALTIGAAGQFTVNGTAINGFSFNAENNYTNNYFLLVKAGTINGSLSNLTFSASGLGTGSWTFSTNSTGLYANYTAPALGLVFTNAVAADQGAANLVTNNAAGAFAAISDSGGPTAVTISNSAPLTFTNPANSYSGVTLIEQGTLVAAVDAPNAANGAFGNASTTVQVGSLTGSSNATLLIGNGGVTVGRGITINSGGSGVRTIGATNASGTATYSGNIAMNTNVTLSASNSAGTTLFSGVLTGSGAATVAGSGTTIFTGANDYTGTTTILTGATLRIANNTALGSTAGNTVVNSGGTLALSNGITEDEAITLSGTGVGSAGAIRSVSGDNTLSGALTLGAASRINSDTGLLALSGGVNGANFGLTLGGTGNMTVSGAITNSTGSLTKDGSGTLTLTGANTYSGGTLVSTGTLVGNTTSLQGAMTNNSLVIFDQLADGTYAGAMSGTGALQKTNAGILTLSASNSYSGGTVINQGGIVVGNNFALGTGTVTNLVAGGSLSTDGTARTISNNLVLSQNMLVGGTGAFAIGGTTTITVGVDLTNNNAGGLALSNVTLGTAGTARTLALRGTGDITINGVIANSSTPNTGSLAISNSGITTLNGNNTYSGTTTIGSTGFLVLGNNNALGSTAGGTVISAGGGTIDLKGNTIGAEALTLRGSGAGGNGALRNSSATAASWAGAVTLETDTTIAATNGAITISGAINANNDALTITNQGDVTLSGAITNSTSTLTKTGTGTLTLSGANTFSGGVTLSAGTLSIGNDSALGTGAANFADGVSIQTADATARNVTNNITLRGLTVGGTGALTLGGTLSLADTPKTITNNNSGGLTIGSINLSTTNTTRTLTFAGTGNTTVTGVIGNGTNGATSGNIILNASGTTLTLSGANTYSGGTTNTAGTLLIANNTALGDTNGNTRVLSGATLAFSNNINSAEALVIAGDGVGSNGALRNVSGNNTNTGTVRLSATNNRIQVDTGTSLTLGAIDHDANTNNLTMVANGTLRVTGAFTAGGANTVLQKDGAGSLVISNSGTTSQAQLQVGNGTVTVEQGSYSTSISTSTRALDVGISSSGDSTNNVAFYANGGVTISNSVYVAPNTASSALRILGTESTNGTATFNREIFLGGNLTVSAASGGTALFSGNLVNTGSITKIGAGTVVLAGANTAVGTVTVGAGTLAITNGSAIANENSVAISNVAGANFVVSQGETIAGLSGGGATGGTVTLNAELRSRFDSASNNFAGTITGSSNLLKGGTGTLTLSGSNNYAGGTIHEAGALIIGNNAALGSGVYQVDFGNTTNKTIAANGTGNFTLSQSNNIYNDLTIGQSAGNTGKLTFAGGTFLGSETNQTRTLTVVGAQEFSGGITGARGIVKDGSGTLILSGNNSYEGATRVLAGTLHLDNNSALGSGSSTLNLSTNGGTTAATLLIGTGITNSRSINAEFGSATKTIAYGISGTGAQLGGVTLGNSSLAFNVGTGGTLVFGGGVTASGSAGTDTNRLALDGGGTLIITNNGSGISSNDQYQVRIGNGTMIIGAGTIIARTNTAGLGHSIDLGLDLNGTAVTQTSSLLASNNVTVSNSIYVSTASSASRVLGLSGTGTATFSGRIDLNSAGITLTAGENGSVTFSGPIANANGTTVNTLTKTGAGTVILSGANTYSGINTISNGTLSISSAGNLGNATGATAVTLNGGALRSTAGLTLGSRGITIGANGGTIDVNTAGLTNTSGLNGTGSLVKTGSGVLHLTNTAGNYAGSITVTNGTLQANTTLRGANISVGNASTANGSVLMGSGSVGAVTINTNGQISPGNSVGTLTVSNSLTFNGGGSYLWEITNATAGAPGTNWDLISVDTGTVGAGTLNIGGDGQFTIAGTAINGFTFDTNSIYNSDYFLIVRAATISGSLDNLAFSSSGLGSAGNWSFSTNATGLYLNYNAPFTTLVFTNAATADQGGANLVNGNTAGAYAAVTNLGGSVTSVTISNSAPLAFTNGNNTYTGGTLIEQGVLVTAVNAGNAGGAFGINAGNISLGSTNGANGNAATLLIGAEGVTVSKGVDVNAGGTGARTIGATNASGVATFAGNVVMNTNVTLSASNSGGTTLFSGTLSGSGAITAAGSGTSILSGANSFTNNVGIASGATLVASNNSALGAGSGITTVSNGATVALAGNISMAENITIAGNGVGSNGALRNIDGANTNTGIITLSANARVSADTNTSLTVGNINLGNTTNQITLGGNGAIYLTGGITNTTTDSKIVKDGNGSLVISNNGTTGNAQMRIAGGSVTLAAGGFSSNTGTGTRGLDLGLDLNGSVTNSVAFYANAGQTMTNSIYVAPAGTGGAGTRTLGTESSSGPAATFDKEIFLGGNVVLSAAAGGHAAFTGAIVNTGVVVKSGAGTVTLSGANTYSGGTTIGAGTLAVGSSGALGSSGTISFGGGTLQYSSNNTSDYSSRFSTAASQAIKIDTAGQNVTFATALSSSGGTLAKTGNGTLTLSGNNSFSGATTVAGGTLRISGNNRLGNTNTTLTISNAGVLEVTGAGTITNAITIGAGNGVLSNSSGGLLVLAGTATKDGTVLTSRSGSGTNVFTGVIQGNSANSDFVVDGGTTVFSNQMTYNGPTIITNGGTLVLGVDDAMPSGSNLILGGGTFRVGVLNYNADASLQMGTLTLTENSTIDFGDFTLGEGDRVLKFAASTSITWTSAKILTITNWQGVAQTSSEVSQLLFGTGGLTSTQLGQIYFANQNINGGALIGGGGELVPVPEPRVYAAAVALLAVVGWRERKRLLGLLGKGKKPTA